MEVELKDCRMEHIEAWTDAFWEELKLDGPLRDTAEKAGFTAAELNMALSSNRKSLLHFRRKNANFDPLTTAIIIAIAPHAAELAGKVAYDIWSRVLLPRIVAEKGQNVAVKR